MNRLLVFLTTFKLAASFGVILEAIFGTILGQFFWKSFGRVLDAFFGWFFGQFLSLLSLLGLYDSFWGRFLERSLWLFLVLFWELIKHMKSGAQFNRPNKHTEGPATRVNKQNLNFRLRIQGIFFKDLGISN